MIKKRLHKIFNITTRGCLSVILLLLLASLHTKAFAQPIPIYCVAGLSYQGPNNFLVVRFAPNLRSQWHQGVKLRNGDCVQWLEQQGDFYRIRVGGRIEGWSAQIYLRENTQASEMRSTTEFPPNQQSTTVETWSKEKQSSLRRVGQCTDTQIAEISGRLQGEPDSGTVIGYTNGVYGVSYQVIQEIRRSRVGDLVRLCLTSIPRDCPKGDDRGKTYRAVNLRTGASWELADSSHMCGGA